MSTYANTDPCTDLILDFIAGGVPGNPSGESFGNYNAVIGNARATDDLGRKTLDDIYTLMADLLVYGRPSTAVGRYQIIRKTLKNLQTSKGLPGTALFTPKLQDSLAVSLLVGRGYPRWWDGKKTDEDFAHGLSCEWASLPDPLNDGKSHYDGDSAGNHAGTSLAAVYAMLRRARAAQKGDAKSRPQPAASVADPAPAPSAWGRVARLFGA
jgi:muramidase (phage lysozyme)